METTLTSTCPLCLVVFSFCILLLPRHRYRGNVSFYLNVHLKSLKRKKNFALIIGLIKKLLYSMRFPKNVAILFLINLFVFKQINPMLLVLIIKLLAFFLRLCRDWIVCTVTNISQIWLVIPLRVTCYESQYLAHLHSPPVASPLLCSLLAANLVQWNDFYYHHANEKTRLDFI